MNLTVMERLMIRNIIPQLQGWNYAHMTAARELIESLFTEQEESDLDLQADGDKVAWNTQKEDGTPIPQERDFTIGDGLKAKIGKFLTQQNARDGLSWNQYELYKKFCGNGSSPEAPDG